MKMEKEGTDVAELVVAVGLTGGRKSKYILRWALDQFAPEGNVRFRLLYVYPKITIVPTPIGTWLPVAQVRTDVTNRYRLELENKKTNMLIPYQQALEAQKIKSDIVVLESDDIASTLCLEATRLSIRHLVVGLSSSSIFSRKHLSLTKLIRDHNISAAISEKAPSFCSVYVIAEGKLQKLRPSESEQTVISMDSTTELSDTCTENSSNSSTLTIGRLLKGKPSSLKYPRSESNSSTKTTKTTKPRASGPYLSIITPIRIKEKVDTAHYTVSSVNDSPTSQSSSSGDSGSWVLDKMSPGNSFAGTTPPISFSNTPNGESFVRTPLSGSFAGTYSSDSKNTTPPGYSGSWVLDKMSPGNSFAGTTPPISFANTPNGESFVRTPLSGSFAGTYSSDSKNTTPPGSFVGSPTGLSPTSAFVDVPIKQSASFSVGGTSRTASYRNTTLPRSSVGTPPVGLSATGVILGVPTQQSAASLEAARSLDQNMMYELEKLRMQLRHAGKMHQLAHNNKIEKALFPINQLNTQSKERLEVAIKQKKERDRKMTNTDNNKQSAASRENAQTNKPGYKEEADGAQKVEDNAKKLKKLIASPVTQCQKFSWNEILDATSSLSEELKIGAGAFGTVYKCKLHHTTVAVKVLHSKDTSTNKQFLQELEILSTIRHPHILLLVGAVPEESCLIYEYMENGSLEDRLFRKDNCPPLPWYERVRICWEVAGALAFLHSTKPKPIIHRDLKPANILLDQHLVSKIGDAGLGTTITMEPSDKSLKTLYKETSPVGTLCYIDPEYQRTGRVSTKSDIYALGIVILQLMTTKPAVGIAYLVEDALEEGILTEILDHEEGKWPEEVALELASLGLLCTELRGRDRPDLIDTVLPALEKLKEAADNARNQVTNAPAAIPAHFLCPISKDIMDDPYVAADGYTYNRAALEKWLEENNTSPITKLPLPHKFIMPNNTMLEAITEWKSSQPP